MFSRSRIVRSNANFIKVWHRHPRFSTLSTYRDTALRRLPYLRSLAFVPGHEQMLSKAMEKSSPDAFVPDLEDSVDPSAKHEAREAVHAFLHARQCELDESGGTAFRALLIPRVNQLESEESLCANDLCAVVAPHVPAVSVGKIESAADMQEFDRLLGDAERVNHVEIGSTRVIPWIETAAGILNAAEICSSSKRITGVAFGTDDFLTSMQIDVQSDEDRHRATVHAKWQLSLAARANRLSAYESPYVDFRSADGLAHNIETAKRIGFTGMFAIHPNQVDAINERFGVTDSQRAQAQRIVDAYDSAKAQGRGSTSVDGIMIDYPVVRRARHVLERAARQRQ